MYKKRVILSILMIIMFYFLYADNTVAFADEDKNIFSLDKDGYFKPTDDIEHDFTVKNIWGEGCYLDYITFKERYIRDNTTLKEYSINEAIEGGFISEYKVTIKLNDQSEGEEVLFEGTMQELVNTKINLKNKIYMESDSVIKFSIRIALDKSASNSYQNKSYQYVFMPSAYKVINYDDAKINNDWGTNIITNQIGKTFLLIKTGDKNLIISCIQIMLLCSSSIVIFIFIRRKNKGDGGNI